MGEGSKDILVEGIFLCGEGFFSLGGGGGRMVGLKDVETKIVEEGWEGTIQEKC